MKSEAPWQYELIVVHSEPEGAPIRGATSVLVGADTALAGRWNAGARGAGGELLAFLSADVRVLRTGMEWRRRSRRVPKPNRDSERWAARSSDEDGTIEHAGLVIGPDRVPYRIYQGDPTTAHHVNRPRIMPAVATLGMVTARARFVEVGGFDEPLGEDLVDADFCLRLRARGLPILYSPAAELRWSPRSVPGTGGDFPALRPGSLPLDGPEPRGPTRWSAGPTGWSVNQQWRSSWRLPRPSAPSVTGLPAVAWTSYFFEFGGYTEEAGAAVCALADAGLHVVAHAMGWDRGRSPTPAHKADQLAALMDRDLPEGFVHVAHMGADQFKRHPGAIRNIGRTMFETDGLPRQWRDKCNAMDEIWVPSEHNLRTFAAAGVEVSKLHKVPETFDADLFDPGVAPLAVDGVGGFVFLSLFSWMARKAWDVLIRAWCEEFCAEDDVTLLLKTDTRNAPPGTDCRREVASFVRQQLQLDPAKAGRVVVVDRDLEATDVPCLSPGGRRAFRGGVARGGVGAPVHGGHGHGPADHRHAVEREPRVHERRQLLPPRLRAGRRPRRRVATGPEVGAAVDPRPAPGHAKGVRASRRGGGHRAAGSGRRAGQLPAPTGGGGGPGSPRGAGQESGRDASAALAAARIRRTREHGGSRHRESQRRSAISRRASWSRATPHPCRQCSRASGGIADATVVVDAGSRDDMASVRNEALDRATGGWVLMLDATHTVDPASLRFIRQLVDRDLFAGYGGRELHQFGLDGAVSSVEERTPVLFPRHPDLRYTGRVGEQGFCRSAAALDSGSWRLADRSPSARLPARPL